MVTQHIFFAALGGVAPALIWLWFWLQQDKLHPEPKRLVLLTFITGGLVVALVIPAQQYVRDIYNATLSTPVLVWWALIEEVFKFAAAAGVVLWRRAVDEPIDDMIYMLTIALGFSAVENTLFLINPFAQSGIVEAIITGNFRFFGATLLHLLSSSIVGAALAFAFHKKLRIRIQYALGGVILAALLHAAFNVFILNATSGGVLKVFAFVWLGVVALLLIFEKIKRKKILPKP